MKFKFYEKKSEYFNKFLGHANYENLRESLKTLHKNVRHFASHVDWLMFFNERIITVLRVYAKCKSNCIMHK